MEGPADGSGRVSRPHAGGAARASLSPVFVHPYGPLAGTLRESSYEELVTELADEVHGHMRRLGLPASERSSGS